MEEVTSTQLGRYEGQDTKTIRSNTVVEIGTGTPNLRQETRTTSMSEREQNEQMVKYLEPSFEEGLR